jgi:environmental stress-induced protein Ves
MTVAILTRDQQRAMPWRNGGGTTRELMVEPPGATFDSGFAWRLSIADVAKDGPFSELPGLDRSMVVIGGPGMTLEFPMGRREAVEPFSVFRFPGEVPCTGHLTGGPVTDVNAMTARGKARHAVRVIEVDAAPRAVLATTLKASAPVVAVVATDRALRARVEGRDHAIPVGAALIAHGVFAVTLAAEARTKAVVVEFAQR